MSNHYTNLLAQAEKLRRHNRQGSYKTKERYYEAYQRFLKFVAAEYHLQKLSNISGKHLAAYIEHMQNIGYAAATIKTDLAAIRFWQDQIPNARYSLPENKCFSLERRQFGKVDRRWSNGEFNRMIAECWKADREDFEACIVIARYAGLRIHEVLRIDTAIANTALRNKFIMIKGKGGKIREVPINTSIEIELRKAAAKTLPGHKLFVPDGSQSHIVKNELQNFIAMHRDAVCDEGRATPLTFHGLRHTYAAEQYEKLIKDGKTDSEAKKTVSRLLGHEREDVTRIYLAGVQKGGKQNV